MSIWGDLARRAGGTQLRAEDQQQDDWEFPNPSAPLIYLGPVDMSSIPAFPKAGEIYFVQDDISINGQAYPSGSMILFDGSTWTNIGSAWTQKIDSNIGYYQPVDVQESSII